MGPNDAPVVPAGGPSGVDPKAGGVVDPKAAGAVVDPKAGGVVDPKAAGTDPKTILAGGADPAKVGAAPPDWPTDWREKLAGGDAKELERLKRIDSPAGVWKSFREAEGKITSGATKTALPENPTAEQLATFRKDNGIPEKPEDYKIELSNGIVVGEAEKPIVNEFLTAMHAKNMPPAAVNTALDTYYALVAKQAAAQTAADGQFHDTSLLELGKEYGTELSRNLSGVETLLGKSFPAEVAQKILQARMPDGRLLGDTPAIVKGFIALMKDAMPGATLVPAGTSNIGKSVTDRIGELNKMMGDRSSDYWHKERGPALQQEYRDLVTASQNMKERAA